MNDEMGIKADGSLARPSTAGLGGNQENAAQVSLRMLWVFCIRNFHSRNMEK